MNFQFDKINLRVSTISKIEKEIDLLKEDCTALVSEVVTGEMRLL